MIKISISGSGKLKEFEEYLTAMVTNFTLCEKEDVKINWRKERKTKEAQTSLPLEVETTELE